MTDEARKPTADWDLIEREYRVGIKTVRQLAKDYGVSHTAIQKRAKKFGWVQDLSEKIQTTAQTLVAKEMVSRTVAKETDLTDAATIKAYSGIVADVDLQQREDLQLAINTQRTLLHELALLADPRFAENLERLGEIMDQSYENAAGNVVKDKTNELYRYIISLAGRVKMAKEIAGAYGVYHPLQRKAFGLDSEKETKSQFEELLAKIGGGA